MFPLLLSFDASRRRRPGVRAASAVAVLAAALGAVVAAARTRRQAGEARRIEAWRRVHDQRWVR
ncbi:hypothetical protein [Actinomarinicola tropica]|uniref:Uncharacterized protein n=1 Tax=Actinomarinicola tropica TaxID=2789776 RepID=A0A5Q2RJ39_9ACTN|nr:hypothetical protein [Actinomarinicola tropica]QGG94406.1 hypothetical protein GH723_04410 [Actinomarinicola tropica]